MVSHLWNKLRELVDRRRKRVAWDTLVLQAIPDQPLADRVQWAENLMEWLSRDSSPARWRLFFQLLDRQPEVRQRVARTLRSLVRDTQAIDLFADTGLPLGPAFLHELVSRISAKILPAPTETRNLADIFDRLFPRQSDSTWLEQLDADTAQRIIALFHYEESEDLGDWNSLRTDLEDAMVQLSDRICVVGSGRDVRGRLEKHAFRDLPFQKLPKVVETLFEREREGTAMAELTAELNMVRAVVEACDRAVDEITSQLARTGVSTVLVYDMARLQAQARRLEMLLEAWSSPAFEASRAMSLLADLVRENHARKSVAALFRQNLHLLTRRIVERNAETGEHYIARDKGEYLEVLRSAAGGGAIMGATTMVKLLLIPLALADFFRGTLYGLNYAIGFVAIQLCGFTVATKQPATTAPALASRMGELGTSSTMEGLVDEVVFLVRSQIASIVGNLVLVIPAMWLLDAVFTAVAGHHIVTPDRAEAILRSVSPWSACWVFAVFTGVLLWASSLIAAAADNWFVFHRLGPALGQHKRFQQWLGPGRALRLARWLERNIAGLTGNVSLGLMLGMAPEIAHFFGVHLDVRHVTLSTGQVTAAYATLGSGRFCQLETLWTLIGILGIGALNVAVSFGLALFVAIRARDIRGRQRNQLFIALGRRMVLAPLSFLLPIGQTQKPVDTA